MKQAKDITTRKAFSPVVTTYDGKPLELHSKHLVQVTTDIFKMEAIGDQSTLAKAVIIAHVANSKAYDVDFKSVSEYAEKVLGYAKSTTSELKALGSRFLKPFTETKGKPEIIDDLKQPEGEKQYNAGQLTALLKLTDEELPDFIDNQAITPYMSVADIRKAIKNYKTPEAEVLSDKAEAEAEATEATEAEATEAEATEENTEADNYERAIEAVNLLTPEQRKALISYIEQLGGASNE